MTAGPSAEPGSDVAAPAEAGARPQREPTSGDGHRQQPVVQQRRSKSSLRTTLTALQHRDYRMLWMSMALAMTGMQMQMITRSVLATDLAPEGREFFTVGVISMAWGISQLFLALIGGAVADRTDKRRILLLTQTSIFVQAVVIGVLVTTGVINLPLMFIFGVALGATFSFNMPARQAFIPELVPREGLMNAVALNNSAMNATRVFAPVAAGVLIASAGFDIAYYVTSVMYAFGLVLIYLLPSGRGHIERAAERGGIFEEIGVGLRYINSNRELRKLMIMAFGPIMIGMPYVTILPAFTVETLGKGSGAFGLLVAASALGGLAGSLAVATLDQNSRLRMFQLAGGILWGVSLAVLAAASAAFGYWGALPVMVIIGFAQMGYITLNNTMIMTTAPPEYHGRVMSMYMMTFGVFVFMGPPLGLLADAIGGIATFAMLGVGLIVFMALSAGARAPTRAQRRATAELEAEASGEAAG